MRGAVLFICAVALLGNAAAKEQVAKKGAKKLLQDAIDSIGSRIAATEEADRLRNLAIQANCTRDRGIVTQSIADKQAEIVAKESEIQASQATIESIEGAIDTANLNLETATQSRDEAIAAISSGDAQRALEAELFINNTEDTEVAIEAIGDIENIIVNQSTLLQNEDDDKNTYADKTIDLNATQNIKAAREVTQYDASGDDYANSVSAKIAGETALLSTHTSGLLRKLSHKVRDPMVRSFIEMTALTVAAMDTEGDVSRLMDLLAKLKVELHEYKQELRTAEDQAKEDWRVNRATWVTKRNAAQAEMDRLEELLIKLNKDLDAERSRKATLETQKLRLEKEKRDLEAQYAALDKMCLDEEQDYKDRSDRRAEETRTLGRIQHVIDVKLGGATDKTKAGTSYEGEYGFSWVKGEWGPCDAGVKTVALYCIEEKTGNEVTEMPELQCGAKPKGLRKACTTLSYQKY